jgi:DNA-binding NtrC family response regulator
VGTLSHKSLRVLFVDDEVSLQEFMRSELPRLGHEVTVCPDGRAALKQLAHGTFDAAILDLRMPGMTGIEVLEKLKQVSPDTEAVVMTGHASQETAIEALRLGAFDYITKPCKLAEIEALLGRIAEKRDLTNKAAALQTRVQAAEGPSTLIGDSPAMQAVHRLIATVAPTDSTVLILGETGTGKELVARTIFLESRRAQMTFVPVNCGALAEHLVESELFGHRKGAFTGAERDHKGLFEVANGGTLFLDELGELNKNIQVKLLRFLESGEIRRVGDNIPSQTDVRVVCATNRDMWDMIRADHFREDLYFRINTFEIRLPSLRERREDLPHLARHLLARALRKPLDQVAHLVAGPAIDLLYEYDWPGNVRELANVMEYASIISGGQPLQPEHFPQHIRQPRRTAAVPAAPAGYAAPVAAPPVAEPVAGAPRTLRDIEYEHILRVLQKHNGHKPSAAAELGIALKTLYNKIHQIEEERSKLAG